MAAFYGQDRQKALREPKLPPCLGNRHPPRRMLSHRSPTSMDDRHFLVEHPALSPALSTLSNITRPRTGHPLEMRIYRNGRDGWLEEKTLLVTDAISLVRLDWKAYSNSRHLRETSRRRLLQLQLSSPSRGPCPNNIKACELQDQGFQKWKL